MSQGLCKSKGGEVKSLSRVRLCDPMDCSLPGFSVHRIFQTRVQEWAAIAFSRGSSRPRDWTKVSSIVGRCFTLWATREVQREGKDNLSSVEEWSVHTADRRDSGTDVHIFANSLLLSTLWPQQFTDLPHAKHIPPSSRSPVPSRFCLGIQNGIIWTVSCVSEVYWTQLLGLSCSGSRDTRNKIIDCQPPTYAGKTQLTSLQWTLAF